MTAAAPASKAPPLSTPRLAQKLGAEMIGTFALVFAGCGAIMVDAQNEGVVGHLGIALTFGAVVGVMIYATGHISGAHFNPAVTVAFAVVGRFPWRQVPAYVGGQVVAALLASLALSITLGDAAHLGATLPAGELGQAFAFEVVLTFFLMFVITAVATDARAVGQMAGLAIGGTVALGAIFGGPVTGASMNPARSLGPALVSGHLDSLWLYIVAPLLGAALGAFAYHCIRCSDEAAQDASGCC